MITEMSYAVQLYTVYTRNLLSCRSCSSSKAPQLPPFPAPGHVALGEDLLGPGHFATPGGSLASWAVGLLVDDPSHLRRDLRTSRGSMGVLFWVPNSKGEWQNGKCCDMIQVFFSGRF